MGTEYALADDAGKRALDCHKSYWLPNVDDWRNVTAADVLAATAESPDARCNLEWLVTLCVKFCESAAGTVRLFSDAGDADEPWVHLPDPTGWYLVRDGWTVYDPWHGGSPSRQLETCILKRGGDRAWP